MLIKWGTLRPPHPPSRYFSPPKTGSEKVNRKRKSGTPYPPPPHREGKDARGRAGVCCESAKRGLADLPEAAGENASHTAGTRNIRLQFSQKCAILISAISKKYALSSRLEISPNNRKTQAKHSFLACLGNRVFRHILRNSGEKYRRNAVVLTILGAKNILELRAISSLRCILANHKRKNIRRNTTKN